MRSFPVATVPGTQFPTPHELNAEFAEEAGVLHALDRDNFDPLELDEEKLVEGAFGSILVMGAEDTVSHIFQIDTGGYQVHWLPDDGTSSDGRMVVPFTSGDGLLRVSLSAYVRDSAANVIYAWVGVRVDGVMVAHSPQCLYYSRFAFFCQGTIAVGPGSHLIEGVYGFSPAYTDAAGRTLEFRDRVLTVQEAVR